MRIAARNACRRSCMWIARNFRGNCRNCSAVEGEPQEIGAQSGEPSLDRPFSLGEDLAARPALDAFIGDAAPGVVHHPMPGLAETEHDDPVAAIEAEKALGHGGFNA